MNDTTHEIQCPHCRKAFTIDEAGYADILKQVRDRDFEQQLEQRLVFATGEATRDLERAAAEKEAALRELKARLDAAATAQQLAVTQAVAAVTQERDALKNGLDKAALEKRLAEQALEDKYQTQIRDRDAMIERLKDLKAKLSTKMIGETLEQHCENEFNKLRAVAFSK